MGGVRCLESALESKFRLRVIRAGALTFKFVSPGHAGVPDRIVLARGGKVYFVEMKRKNGKLRPLQRYTIQKMRDLGFSVSVIDSEEAITAFIAQLTGGDDDG